MIRKSRAPLTQKQNPQSGNIFFMLFASIALIGAMTVGAGNTIKGLVSSMSDVTRKTVAEEKMQGAARISIMNATTTQTGNTVAGDCDADGMVEPLPARDPGTSPAPVNGGLVPENIGATTKDPWGTEFGYCAWDPGSITVSDNNAGCGGNTALRLDSEPDAAKTVVAIISAGKDRKFSTTCGPATATPADCTGKGTSRLNDPASGHCYFTVGTFTTATASQAACAAEGGSLATANSSAEHTLITSFLNNAQWYYLGFGDSGVEGNFAYQYGSEAGTVFWTGGMGGSATGDGFVTWGPWDPDDPPGGEDCGGYYPDSGSLWMGSFACTNGWAINAVCEIEPTTSSHLTKTTGSDDIVMEYTYNDANGMSGDDLWKIRDTKPGTAKIDKNIEVSGSADLSGPLNLMRSGLVLPGDDPAYVCDATTDQQLRINFSNNPAVLEICDFSGGGDWIAVSMGDTGGGGGGSGMPSGLVSWWKFDDATGTTAADSTGTNPGTLTNGPTWTTGINGGALQLDGSNDYVVIPAAASINNLRPGTFCTWYNVDAWNGNMVQGIFDKTNDPSGNAGPQFYIYNSAPGKDLTFYTGEYEIRTNASATLTTWEHFCASYDGTAGAAGVKIYKNGTLAGVLSQNDYGNFPIDDSANDIRLGRASGGASKYYFDGKIDDTVLFNRVLSDAEILQVMNVSNGGGGSTTPLPAGAIAYWPFDDGAGTTAADSIGSNDGTFSGSPAWTTGLKGGALQFNGSSYVNFGSAAAFDNLQAHTICAWVNLENTGSWQNQVQILTKADLGFTAGWGLALNDASNGVDIETSAINNSSNYAYVVDWDSVPFDTWAHICATADGSATVGGTKVYLDGSLASIDDSGSGSGATSDAAYNFMAGNNMTGKLDEIILYDRVLTATEIGDVYQNGLGGAGGGSGPADCTGLGTNHYNDSASGHCYFRLAGPMNWTTAKASCEANGGYLANISSAGENTIVESLLVTDGWIGATDQAVNDDWRWSNDNTQFWSGADTGSPVGGAYNSWSAGEPNDYGGPASENCAFMFEGVGDWNDEECNGGVSIEAICEKGAGGGGAPTSGLVLYYPFNDAGTAADDMSPAGNNDAIWGFGGDQYEFAWTAAGRIGGGAVSDNSPDGISAANSASLNTTSFTIGAWINPVNPGTGNFVQIMNKWDGSWHAPYYFGFESTTGRLGCGYSRDNATDWEGLEATDPVPWGVWTHVSCTFDNATKVMKIYINGIEANSATLAGTPDSTSTPLWIGWLDEFGANEPYEGIMDEVRLYNRALSPAEVGTLAGIGGGAAEVTITPDSFMTDSQAKQCTSAGKGPLVKVSESDNSNYYRALSFLNGYLFAGGYNTGVSVFDTNGDGTVTRLDTNNPSGGSTASDSYYDGSYYYVANGFNELVAYTFDGTSLTEVASIDTPGISFDVKGYNRNLFVADGDAVRAYTFDGTTFTMTGEFDLGASETYDLWTDGRFIYVSANDGGLVVLTFNGTSFTEVTRITANGFIEESTGDGRYIYANASGDFIIYGFDGATLTEVAKYNRAAQYVKAVYADGANIYVAWSDDKLEVLRFGGIYPEVVASYETGDEVESIRSDGSYLYVARANSPMLVLSGVSCQTSSNNALGVVLPGANPFEGKLSVNENGACAIKPDGAAWCWGGGPEGELGNGTATPVQETPVRVNTSGQFVSLAGAGLYNCGLKNDGTGWCWGADDSERLGNGAPTANQLSPSRIATPYRFSQITAGDHHGCGLAFDGRLYCWGENDDGQLGIGSTGGTQNAPTAVDSTNLWVYVAAGGYATCAIDMTRELWCWGHNDSGILGTGEHIASPEDDPTWVRDPGPWLKVAVGFVNICGIKNDGSLWCWGYTEHGVAGAPTLDNKPANVPVRIADPGPWVDVALSSDDDTWGACGIKQDGTAWCWGLEVNGNFGNGSTAVGNQYTPSRVLDPGPWAAIGISNENTCGMKTDGSVWCWGDDSVGQLGNGTTITGIQHVPSRVANFPNMAPWAWDDAGMNITAAGSANIALGATGAMGYTAPGFVYDCSAYGTPYYNDPATGHCYYRGTGTANWSNSQAACGTYGGYLAAITSASEHAKVSSTFGSATEFWIGAADISTEGDWVFTGGEKTGQSFWSGTTTGSIVNGLFNAWNPGVEPSASAANEDCAILNFGGSPVWHDSACGNAKAFICEIGTAEAAGGLSFPSAGQAVLQQYEGGSELLIETGSTSASAQLSLKANSAANTRSVGIDHSTDNFEIGLNNSNVDNWMHAITPQMLITPDGNVGVGTGNTIYNKLQINGGLRLGNDTTACNASRSGTLRYVGGPAPFEYCNGSAWTPF